MRDPFPVTEPTATGVSIGRLKRRTEFLRAAKGRRWHGKAFSLQAAASDTSHTAQAQDTPQARVGITVTKKVGCSVVRNRARRRLREALRLAKGLPAKAGHDYVVIARVEALRVPFTTLQNDLLRAVRSVHAEARPHDAPKRPLTRSRPQGE